ncbi:MAG: pentapeptide repeat-containing protein [Deltaproteobacteria bacterium]|jgi:hypothetical protein|nr:pentapeptide repeat-containing protein [Deltaproteobacteria bacterium]
MAQDNHVAILDSGIKAWNKWRDKNPNLLPDLRGADISEEDLRGIDFTGANLSRTNMSGADLSEAVLLGAILYKANLSKADLSDATLRWADLSRANLSGADLTDTDLRRTQLARTDLSNANLTGTKVYGIAAWNLKLDGTNQSGLVITDEDEPVITVDDIEVAQFIYLLLNNKKIRNVLNAVTERGVLILGRFARGGLALLQSVAAELKEFGYLPIIFDFDRPDDRNFTETIMTLAGLSRFIIAELSGPSVPQELHAVVPNFKIPIVPILKKGARQYAMFRDLLEYPWVMPPVLYSTRKQLLELIQKEVIVPAETAHKKRQKLLDTLFST